MYVNFREGYSIFVYSTKPYIMTTVIANVRKEKKKTLMLTTRMVMMMVVVVHTVVVQFLFFLKIE